MTLSAAEQRLVELDPILGASIMDHGSITHTPDNDYFAALASSIISQQVSVKAAATIFARFKTHSALDPVRVLELSEAVTKTIGLSRQKASYIRDLAEHFVNDQAVFDHLDTLDDEAVIGELTRVKGIGVWTAQMFLIFTLQRPDVFAPDDRGLQLAIEKIYEQTMTRHELVEFAQRWAPYRTTASLHLWQSLNNTPK